MTIDGARLTPALHKTLTMVADLAEDAAEPWWIIGSAAVALHGASIGDVRDVDLLMDAADATRILERLGLASAPDSAHPQFRSSVFGIWSAPPLPVEIFAGFRLASEAGQRPVRFRTRHAIHVSGRTLFVPSRRELHALLLSFGRPKDLERARLLVASEPNAPAARPAPAPWPSRPRSSS